MWKALRFAILVVGFTLVLCGGAAIAGIPLLRRERTAPEVIKPPAPPPLAPTSPGSTADEGRLTGRIQMRQNIGEDDRVEGFALLGGGLALVFAAWPRRARSPSRPAAA